jgi:hypothetical protein
LTTYLAADLALLGLDDPFAVLAPTPVAGAEPQDLRAQVARALGQRLGQLRGVDVAIVGIVERALQIMRFDERDSVLDLVAGVRFPGPCPGSGPCRGALEFLHPLLRMRQPDRAGDVVVHRVVDRLASPR